jgi:hypothetical protein
MKFLAKEDVVPASAYGKASVERERLRSSKHQRELFLDPKSGRSDYSVAWSVGRWLFEAGYEDDVILAYVYETGVWPSNENRHLYYVWRRSHGDLELIEESPCHLFLFHESHELISLLHMALLFGWGIRCYARTFERGFDVDHDRRALLVAGDAQSLERVANPLLGNHDSSPRKAGPPISS